MLVSMIQMIFEIPDIQSIKDKRKVVKSIKDKWRQRYHLSAAEVDLQDSLTFSQLGGALVSNSKAFGEEVMQKALKLVEDDFPVRIQDVQIHTEEF
jgi:uncharacterized protein YlxP (DUF503 family)